MQPPISVGTVLQNRYRIIQILGQGGFGRTYLAEDQRRFNELCAIKELIPSNTEPAAWAKAQELFQREAEILYQIEHKQIPKFRERFEQEQRLFLVQDYVPGKTYRTLLSERSSRGGAFSESEVFDLMRSLLPVLEYIHSRGIIHRDISPENIILRINDSRPVLIDFGVVKEIATQLQGFENTTQGTTVGKLGYSPSEQMQTGKAYPSSDLYSLAVTAIVLLTAREPHQLFDDTQLAWKWENFTTVNPRFAQILNRMLNYRPSERYQDATEVAIALQGANQLTIPTEGIAKPNLSQALTVAVGHRPDLGQPPAPPPVSPKPDPVIPDTSSHSVLDNPLAIGAIASVVIVIAGFGSWSLVNFIRSNQSKVSQEQTVTSPQTFPSPVIVQESTQTPTPGGEQGAFEQLSFTADGTATATGTITSNQTKVYTFEAREGQRLVVSQDEVGTLMTILGPDSKPVDGSANRVKFYQGTISTTGKYSIELRTIQGISQGDYVLSVKLEAAKVIAPETPKEQPTLPESTTLPSTPESTTEPAVPDSNTQPSQPQETTEPTKPKPVTPVQPTKPKPPIKPQPVTPNNSSGSTTEPSKSQPTASPEAQSTETPASSDSEQEQNTTPSDGSIKPTPSAQ